MTKEVVIEAMASAWWNTRRYQQGNASRICAGSPPWRNMSQHSIDGSYARERTRQMLDKEELETPITTADDAMFDVALILGAMTREDG